MTNRPLFYLLLLSISFFHVNGQYEKTIEYLLENGLKRSEVYYSSDFPIDTIVDFSNPQDSLCLYINALGKVELAKYNNIQFAYDYDSTGVLKSEKIYDRGVKSENFYNSDGSLESKLYYGRNGINKSRFKGDTTFMEVKNLAGEVMMKRVYTKDTSLFTQSYTHSIDLRDFQNCGLTYFQLGIYSHDVISYVDGDTTNCWLKLKFLALDSSYRYMSFYKGLKSGDSSRTEFLNAQGDTIKRELKIRSKDNSFNIKTRITEYLPSEKSLYRKEVYRGGALGEHAECNFYNEEGKLYLKEVYKVEGTCGTPSVYPTSKIPGYKLLYTYKETQGAEIEDTILALSDFSYQSYFRLNSPYENRFKYRTGSKQFISEPDDVLVFEEGEITVKAFKSELYNYLLSNKLKLDKDGGVNYQITWTKEQGWKVGYNDELDKFKKAFYVFVEDYNLIKIKPKAKRGVYLSYKNGEKEKKVFDLEKIEWQCKW